MDKKEEDLKRLSTIVKRSFQENSHPRVICEDGMVYLICEFDCITKEYIIVPYNKMLIDAVSFLELINVHGGICEQKTLPEKEA